MENTIRVNGVGRMRVMPDMMRLTITLVTRGKELKQINSEASRCLNDAFSAVEVCGIAKTELKLADAGVSPEYEPWHEGQTERRLIGYALSRRLTLEHPIDTLLLGRLFDALADGKPELNVDFYIKDTDSAEEELLRRAAKNARRRAEALAEASGVGLGELCAVSFEDMGALECGVTYKLTRSCADAGDFHPGVQEQELEKCAIFEWKIGRKG